MRQPNPAYQDLACKVCAADTQIFTVFDFNRSWHSAADEHPLPLLGWPVYYHQCQNCGFIFTVDFDRWTKQDFFQYIYNEKYPELDPEFDGTRSARNSRMFEPLTEGEVSILDYGAGQDQLSPLLRQKGYSAVGWDPMWDHAGGFDPQDRFDLVTAFEVFEHNPQPRAMVQDIAGFLKPSTGKVVFTTLVLDGVPTDERRKHWYLSPRNGHVSIYSSRSLSILFDSVGMQFSSYNSNLHAAYRQ